MPQTIQLLIAIWALAQASISSAQQENTPAPAKDHKCDIKALQTTPPKYPFVHGQPPQGANVMVEFDILPDGRTHNLRIIEARPKSFSTTSLQAVEQWLFESTPEGAIGCRHVIEYLLESP